MEDKKYINKKDVVQTIALVALLGLSIVLSYLFSALVAAYGSSIVLSKKNKVYTCAFLLSSVAVVSGMYFAGYLGVLDVVSVCTAYFVGVSASLLQWKKRLSWNLLCWLILLVAAIALTGDVVATHLSGSTLSEQIALTLSDLMDSLKATSEVEETQALAVAVSMMQTYWPQSYLLSAALLAAMAQIGNVMAQRSLYKKASGLTIAKARFSKVFALVLVVAAAALFVGPRFSMYHEQVAFVASNALVPARIICFIQGAGLAVYVLQSKSTSKLLRALLVVTCVFVDLNLFIVSAMGAVDAFANFRRYLGEDKLQA